MNTKIYQNLAYLLIIVNMLFQWILFGKYINGDTMSALQPFFGDSKEYVSTTELWINTHDFVAAFKSGWRLPGYGTFMRIIYKFAFVLHLQPLLLLKIFQLILSSFIPFFSYKAVLNFSKSPSTALFTAFVVCIYYPFYYFTPMVSAESISLFFLAVLLFQISFIANKRLSVKNIFLIAANIAALTYFKPNHILFSIPIGILLIIKNEFWTAKFFNSIKQPCILAFFIIILMLPWVIFVSSQNKMFVPLATTSGVDMVIGTGVPINDKNRDTNSLTYKYEMKHNLVADTIFMASKNGLTSAQANAVYQKEATSIWKDRPWITFKYGLVKIAHSTGLGFRGAKDYFSFIVIIPCLLILLFGNQFRKKYKNLVILIAILFLLFWLQCFVYFGDMRLRILMIDMPLVYIVSIFFYDFYKRKISSRIF